MKWRRLFIGLFLAQVASAETEIITGKIFSLGGSLTEPLFVQTTEVKFEGGYRRMNAFIKDANLNIVMTERTIFKDGLLLEQDVEQKQIAERYELRVRDGKSYFKIFKSNGKTEELEKEKSERTPEVFLTGPGFEPFLRTHEKFLREGKKVSAQFGVLELARSVGFDFKSVGHRPSNDHLKILMEPSSFWLSMLVSPILMEIDQKTLRVLNFKGRTPLRVKEGKKWKPIDAEIHYSFEKVKP
jgi:hypothetical protein